MSDVLHKLTTLGDSESGGGFEEPSFYLAGGFVLLVLGAVGLAWRKPFTIWHIVPILSAIFVLIQFFFYRRFFLYFEFFLLPFAAWSVVWIWQQRNTVWRVLLLAFVAAQGYGAVRQMVLLRPPSIDQQTFALIEEASKTVEDGATVVALENLSAPWLLGWMPEQTVAGPGMFNVKWNEDDWGKLLLGTQTEKEQVLRKSSKDGNLYLFAGPYFFEHYGTVADSFLKNSCFNRVGKTALYKVTCR